MAGLFSDPQEITPFQSAASSIAGSMSANDPWGNIGKAIGLMFAARDPENRLKQSVRNQELAFMNEFGKQIDWVDPNQINELARMAGEDYGLTSLSANLMQESISTSKKLAEAAAASRKDRDVSPMTDKNADAIEKFLSSKEIEGGTENYSLINDIHTWSQKKNWSYDQALEYLLNTKYQSLPSSSWFGRDFKLTPRAGEGTAAAVQQPTVSNAEEEARKRLEKLRAGK
jgi:hypothetical protein